MANRPENLTDEQLVALAQGSSGGAAAEELMRRHAGLVKACARSFFLTGGEHEDLLQEGMLGLLSAVRDYKPDRNMQFKSFAMLCVNRRLSTAVKQSLRDKHKPLTNYISLSPAEDDGEKPAFEAYADGAGPEDIALARERLEAVNKKIAERLSALERKVLREYLHGSAYGEIAARLGLKPKSIDNALQRIKKKLTE